MSADAKKEEGEGKKKKGLPMPVMIVIFLVVGLLVGKTVFGGAKPDAKDKGKKEKNKKSEKEKGEKSEEGHYLPLEEFTVNLSGKGDHYLKTAVSVKVPKTMTEEKFKEVAAPMRDAVVMTLSSKELKDLLPAEGKEKLKEQLKDKLNAAAKEEDLVEEVCFTSFATQ